MTTRIKLRRDTAANWLDANPILSAGEPGVETDSRQIKYGDGVTPWRDLDYANTKIKSMTPVTVTTQDPHTWVNMIGKPKNACLAAFLAYDSQGNLLVASQAYGGATGYDSPLVNISKFDEAGNTIWSRDIPSNELNNFAGGVAVDSLDNVYVAISIWNGTNYTYGTVLKLAGLDGATRWIESFDNNQYNNPVGLDVGPDDQPVVVGTTGGDHNRGFAIKFNSASGDITQAKIWSSSADTAITGMAIDSDNNVIISGLGYNTDTDTNFALVQKLDPTLTPIWTKSIPTVKNSRNNTIYDDGGGDVAVDAAGNIFLTGYFVNWLSGGSSSYIVVMKLNSDGIIQWSRDIRGDCNAVGNSITVGQDGLVYLAGYTGRLVYTQTNVETKPLSQLLMACYAPDTGKVLWQRTMDTPDIGFTVPGVNFDTSPQYRAGSCIAVMGDRLALCGSITPVGKNGYDTYNWGNIKAWALQIPANGELVDISGWRLEEGRIPGRYQSFATVDYTGFGTVSAFEWGSSSGAYVESNSALAVTTLLQDSNSWKFGTNGDLKLPDDGDLDIGKRQVGWINLQGHKVNYDSNVEFQGICVDNAGNSYGFGIDYNDGDIAYVVKYDADGGIVYQKQLWYPPADSRNPVYGNIEGGVYDQTNDRVVMIVSDYDHEVSYVVAIKALTGDVFSATKLDMGITRFDTYDIDLFANGNPVVVGKVGNGFKTHALTPLAGAAADYYNRSWMDVNATDFAPDAAPQLSGQGNWKITGTGIVGEQYTYGVNYYDPLTATPVPGLGATFNVTVTSATYASVAVVAGGTGYKSGDVIIILGTSLGGVILNNLQLTVDAVDGGAIIGVSILGGTATGADAVYTAQPGITQVGTGATFYLEKYDDSGPTYNLRTSLSGGSGYKSGDILKLLGSKTGGVNTTNDITITVNSVDGGGAITAISSTGLVSLATVRLIFDLPTHVNFGDTTNGRAWQLGSYTGGDAVLWTATWHNIFGVSTGNDQAESVAVNKNTGDIFVGGTTSDYTPYYSGGPTTWVAKFNSAGARQWVMNLDQENGIKYNSHIALDSNGDVIVCCYSNYADGRDVWKLKGTDGTPQWRTMTDNENIFNTYDGSVAVDGDDNIIVTGEDDYSQWIITKIDTSGTVLWQNRLRTANVFYQQYQNNGTRWTAIYGDHLFTGGTTDAVSGDQDYNGFLAKLPLTGEGTDGIDEFDYQEIQIPFSRQTFPSILGEWAILVVNAHTGITSSSINMISVPEVSYETTTFPVLSATGGGIVFGDGTRQETSASLLKQRLVSNGGSSNSDYRYTYKIRANDAGKHILLTNSQNVWLPSWHDVEFPVGTVLTIINWSGNTRRVYYESGNYGLANGSRTTQLGISGGDADYYNSFLVIPSYTGGNVVTLIKIRDDKFSDVSPGGAGDVTSYWIATGTNLSFND